MKIPAALKLFCVYLMTGLMTNIPNMVFAESLQSSAMIPTSTIVSDLTHEQAQAKIQDFLKRDDVKKQLVANGVSVQEAQLRLASLSPLEMKNLASQMDQARAGGDVLILILVVVLIIFLIRRI